MPVSQHAHLHTYRFIMSKFFNYKLCRSNLCLVIVCFPSARRAFFASDLLADEGERLTALRGVGGELF